MERETERTGLRARLSAWWTFQVISWVALFSRRKVNVKLEAKWG